MKVSIVVLAYNSELTLYATLLSARELSDDLIVVDSFSSDGTVAVAERAGARVIQHDFFSYGVQRNWAIDNLDFNYSWQLHLDADEVMDPALISAITECPGEGPISGYVVARYLRFLGRELRHGGMAPTWHLRLFKGGLGRCEERKYDQHFYVTQGRVEILAGRMIDDIQMGLSEWTARHNRWSDAEVAEQLSVNKQHGVVARLNGNPIERRRALRRIYNKLPILARPLGLFLFRYFLCAGFLDGKEGLIFWVLQTFWFRFLVDAKLFEAQRTAKSVITASIPSA